MARACLFVFHSEQMISQLPNDKLHGKTCICILQGLITHHISITTMPAEFMLLPRENQIGTVPWGSLINGCMTRQRDPSPVAGADADGYEKYRVILLVCLHPYSATASGLLFPLKLTSSMLVFFFFFSASPFPLRYMFQVP